MAITLNPANPTKPGWGVGKSIDTYKQNIITDWETTTEPQAVNVTDNNGAVCERVVYDTKTSITATLLVQEEFALPKPEDKIKVGSDQFYVVNVREVQSNKDFRKVVLTLERYEQYPKGA